MKSSLQNQLYTAMGFSFIPPAYNNEISADDYYDLIHNAIDLGDEFEKICDNLNLDTDTVGESLKNYILHLVCDDMVSISHEEFILIRYLLENTDIAEEYSVFDLLTELYFTSAADFYTKYENRINILYQDDSNSYKKLRKRLFKDTEPSSWHKHAKVPGSFTRLYLDHAQAYKRGAITPKDKISDFKAFYENILLHYNKFTELLEEEEHDNSYIYSEELLTFERDTDIIFLLAVSSIYDNNQDIKEILTDQHKAKYYFRILASFSMADDILLKLDLAQTFISYGSIADYKLENERYQSLFKLLLIYIPTLKEYLKEKLLSSIPDSSSVFHCIDTGEIAPDDLVKAKLLERKLFIYSMLSRNHLYYVKPFPTSINNPGQLSVFKELYSQIDRLRQVKHEFMQDADEYLINSINKRKKEFIEDPNELLNQYLYYICCLFLKDGELMHFTDIEGVDLREIDINYDTKFTRIKI